MPVVAHDQATEIPWRPGYRVWRLAGAEQGVGCSVGVSEVEPGAGAPLHIHDGIDEVLIVIEGRFEFRIGEEKHEVAAGHTVAIPAGVPHGFTALGPGVSRFYSVFPVIGAFARTRYLEGDRAPGADQR